MLGALNRLLRIGGATPHDDAITAEPDFHAIKARGEWSARDAVDWFVLAHHEAADPICGDRGGFAGDRLRMDSDDANKNRQSKGERSDFQ